MIFSQVMDQITSLFPDGAKRGINPAKIRGGLQLLIENSIESITVDTYSDAAPLFSGDYFRRINVKSDERNDGQPSFYIYNPDMPEGERVSFNGVDFDYENLITSDLIYAAIALSVSSGGTTEILAEIKNTFLPEYIFGVDNDISSGKRSVVNSIYLDNILKSKSDVRIDGITDKMPLINKNTAITNSVPKKVALMGSGYNPKVLSTSLVSTKASVLDGKKVMLFQIGVSTTADVLVDRYRNQKEVWNHGAQVLWNILRDKEDLPSIPTPLLIGHRSVTSRTGSYKGEDITVKGGVGAIGGWCCTNFLRHAMQLNGKGEPAGGIGGQLSYYLLGLKAFTGTDWTGSDAQIELIRTTVQGSHPIDKNAVVWNWMKPQSGWTGGSGIYTASVADNNAIDVFNEAKLADPDNHFYSVAKARSLGATNAMDFDVYLSRYRTHLAGGEIQAEATKGTKVTNVNDFFVCEPTHVSVNIDENDRYRFNVTVQQERADIATICGHMKNKVPGVIIGVFTNPNQGTLFPERYDRAIAMKRDNSINDFKFDLNVELKSFAGSLANQITTKIYYVPVFNVAYPLSNMGDRVAYDEQGEILINGDYADFSHRIHQGLEGAISWGNQEYAWILYSLSV